MGDTKIDTRELNIRARMAMLGINVNEITYAIQKKPCVYSVRRSCVSEAINYKSNTAKAVEIRRLAEEVLSEAEENANSGKNAKTQKRIEPR